MALYTKEQLSYERSIGLQLSDAENEGYNSDSTVNYSRAGIFNWTNQEFESWLSTKHWDERVKNMHRGEFKGLIILSETGISYEM